MRRPLLSHFVVPAVLSLGACPPSAGSGDASTSSASASETGGSSNTSTETTSTTSSGTSSSDPSGDPTVSGPRCGNGVLDDGETCDDGNISNADSCLADCTPASCGDGFLWIGTEKCDDGPDNDAKDPNSCRLTCTKPACGDSALYPASFGDTIPLGQGGDFEIPRLNETSPRSIAIDSAGDIYTVVTTQSNNSTYMVIERYTAEGAFKSYFPAVQNDLGVFFPSLGVSADGKVTVTWQELGFDLKYNVFYSRFTADGEVLVNPTSITVNTANHHRNAVVAVNKSGTAIIAFRSQIAMAELHEIRARIIPAEGAAPDPFVVSTFTGTSAPSVAIRGDGSFVIAYSERSTPGKVYIHDYNSDGAQQLVIEAIPGLQGNSDDNFPWVGAAALENGDFAVAAATPGGELGIKRYNQSGELIVDLVASSMAYALIPQIDLHSDAYGNLVALWAGCGIPGEQEIACKNVTRLHLRQIHADGELFGEPILVDPLDNWQRRGIGIAMGSSNNIAVVAQNLNAPFLKIAKVSCP